MKVDIYDSQVTAKQNKKGILKVKEEKSLHPLINSHLFLEPFLNSDHVPHLVSTKV